MPFPIKTLTSIFTLIVVAAFSGQVSADEYKHIDQLARRIQSKSKQLLRETRHYRHTPEYGHMVSDTNELYRLAKHIHDVTHFEGNLIHLQRDLDLMDQKFHHLEGVFDRVEHDAAFGVGHIHGNTAHVKRLLDSIEDSIHHISIDVQNIRRRQVYSPPVCMESLRPVYRPVYPVYGGGHGHGRGHDDHDFDRHGSYGGGFGFSIGGGSSRIHFRF